MRGGRLSSGPGAFALYQFDRREVLRYTQRDRMTAYRRAFGYGNVPVLPNSRANTDFHNQFTHFINQVTLYWRDKRISDVIRERAFDPSFGSVRLDKDTVWSRRLTALPDTLCLFIAFSALTGDGSGAKEDPTPWRGGRQKFALCLATVESDDTSLAA